MVLGLRSKNRKGASVQVDYLINVREIKPWPPSQSLASAQSVLLQWENGEKNVGSFTSNAGDGKVEFGKSFRLPVTLCKEGSKKSNAGDIFQKNYLEFDLYDPRKDKTTKGQLLGSAIINLAEYGVIKDVITLTAPVNLKKSFKSSAQSFLYLSIQPFDKENSSLSKEVSLDGSETVSEVTNEGIDEESEIASFTDDDDNDVSSNSSRNASSLALESSKGSSSQHDENGSGLAKSFFEEGLAKSGKGRASEEPTMPVHLVPSTPVIDSAPETVKHQNGASYPASQTKLSSTLQNPINSPVAKVVLTDDSIQVSKNQKYAGFEGSQTSKEADGKTLGHNETRMQGVATNTLCDGLIQDQEKKEQKDHGWREVKHTFEEKPVNKFPEDATTSQVQLRSNTQTFNRTITGVQGGTRKDKLKHLKSVQLQFSSAVDDVSGDSHFMEKAKKTDIAKIVDKGSKTDVPSEIKENTDGFLANKINSKSKAEVPDERFHEPDSAKVDLYSTVGKTNKVQTIKKGKDIDLQENVCKHVVNSPSSERKGEMDCSENKVELKSKVEMLEEELMEAAAVEIGLYSVVAEHGSSTNKVHAPARRLSRFYLHTCKARSKAQRASAARAIISGLVLVSKACGNDVPRLSFWLSNTIMLRTIVSQAVNGNSNLKDQCESFHEEAKASKSDISDEWEEPQTYIVVLEKVEAWIFSRIVESVWWQTLTPHMQSTAVRGSSSRKTHARKYRLGNEEQVNFAVDLWKKAFKDSCERLCPIRAEGHDCGCLPLLARLVMEQLVCRLDVAMFNAILRESADEMPTDPVSDPISDPKVLPIPAGKSSFGAGAQLKNAVGNWSRWLTDLFGIDDVDCPDDMEKVDSHRLECETSFKAFPLLHAFSDLMMLPFEMLADSSTRKEVCPTFDAPTIRRVLNNFVPDEFNPDPIPETILQALDSEDLSEDGKDTITSFPFIAAPTSYSPPPAASLLNIVGEMGSQPILRSGSAILRKSYTSDDELDELDSPMTSIVTDNPRASVSTASNWMPKEKGGRKVVRYQLLREVWKNGE